MKKIPAYAALSPSSKLEPFIIERREVGEYDVDIEVKYAGVLRSDLQYVNNEWGFSTYPLVPGAEIVGYVRKIGPKVTKFKVGEMVGVGDILDSCRSCDSCKSNLEQYCLNEYTGTFNDTDKKYGGPTYGGYSKYIVVDENYVLRLPENLNPDALTPLLFRGVASWSALKHWGVGKHSKVGIIGIGGIGHIGVKLAHALGCHVVMITANPNKEGLTTLGGDEILVPADAEAMAKHTGTFDLLLDTLPIAHDINPYLMLLKRDSTLVMLGAAPLPCQLNTSELGLIMMRRSLSASLLGGIKETQEMLDFCGQHKISANTELINIQDINEAYTRMLKNEVRYCFVIDMSSLADL